MHNLKQILLNEGTWSINKKFIPIMIKELKKFKKNYWNKVGDDELYDGIDIAINRLKELKNVQEMSTTGGAPGFSSKYFISTKKDDKHKIPKNYKKVKRKKDE